MQRRPVRIRLVTPDQEGDPWHEPVTTAEVHITVTQRDGQEWEAPTLAEGLVHFLSEDGYRLFIRSTGVRGERRDDGGDVEDDEARSLVMLERSTDVQSFETALTGIAQLSGVAGAEHSLHHDWTYSSVLELTGNVGVTIKEFMLPADH